MSGFVLWIFTRSKALKSCEDLKKVLAKRSGGVAKRKREEPEWTIMELLAEGIHKEGLKPNNVRVLSPPLLLPSPNMGV